MTPSSSPRRAPNPKMPPNSPRNITRLTAHIHVSTKSITQSRSKTIHRFHRTNHAKKKDGFENTTSWDLTKCWFQQATTYVCNRVVFHTSLHFKQKTTIRIIRRTTNLGQVVVAKGVALPCIGVHAEWLYPHLSFLLIKLSLLGCSLIKIIE